MSERDAFFTSDFSGELARVLTLPLVAEARAGGIDDSEILGLAQAYIRGVTRIIAAETQVTARMLSAVAPAEREQRLTDWLSTMSPLSEEMFEAVHGPALEAAARALLSERGDPRPQQLAVAFVDLRGSTAFMLDSSAARIAELVDGLFIAAQTVAERRAVMVSKHLGDGVLLVGRELGETLLGAAELILELQNRTPLRACAGVDFGPVTERAGDHFGPPVNYASRLAEAAPTGGMLLSATAVPPQQPDGEWVHIDMRGLSGQRRVFRIS